MPISWLVLKDEDEKKNDQNEYYDSTTDIHLCYSWFSLVRWLAAMKGAPEPCAELMISYPQILENEDEKKDDKDEYDDSSTDVHV